MTMIPIWTISYDAVEGILGARPKRLSVTAIMIGVSQRRLDLPHAARTTCSPDIDEGACRPASSSSSAV